MLGSKYTPLNRNDYGAKDLNINYKGSKTNLTKNSSNTIDYLISDDHLVDGGAIIATNVVMGDKVTCKVVDVDNILGYGAGVVLNTFVTDWYLSPGSVSTWDFTVPYPAKIYGGLYIRIIYDSVGTETDPVLAINYKIHKVLW